MNRASSTEESALRLLWTAEEVAEALGVSVRFLYKLNDSGRLPRSVKLGRTVRWRSEEIRRWLDAGAPERARWEAMEAKGSRA